MTADNIGGYVTDTGRTIPCEARPYAGLVHLDGMCGCFTGGPGPEWGPGRPLPRFAGVGDANGVNVAPETGSADVVTDSGRDEGDA